MIKDLNNEDKKKFFHYLVDVGDDLGKIAYLWLSCSNRPYIRQKLEIAFESDLEYHLTQYEKKIEI